MGHLSRHDLQRNTDESLFDVSVSEDSEQKKGHHGNGTANKGFELYENEISTGL